MTPDNAKFLLDHYVRQVAEESKITRKVLAAVPDGQGGYQPSERCMSAFELALHIAKSEVWFLESIANGAFGPYGERPESVTEPSHVTAWYEAHQEPALARVAALGGEEAARVISFYTFQLPAVQYLSFALKHSVHHRGQLSAYLRPMGGRVPSIYGGSADEPMAG